jgi:hypothetical protein
MSLVLALNPVLLGLILLVMSRPHPVKNLLVYWAGAVAVNIPLFLAPLVLLHVAPGFAPFADAVAAQETTTSSHAFRPVPFGTAVILFTIVAVMTARGRAQGRARSRMRGPSASPADVAPQDVRHPGRRRRPVSSPRAEDGSPQDAMPSRDLATMVMEPGSAPRDSGPLRRLAGMVEGVVTRFRHLFGRLSRVWESGSLWVALVFGMAYLPSVTLVLLVDTTIATSGRGIEEQVIAAIVFVLGFLAVLEITLLSYLVAPARTEAVLRPLHGWARDRNRQILAVFFAAVGCWQLLKGVGLL